VLRSEDDSGADTGFAGLNACGCGERGWRDKAGGGDRRPSLSWGDLLAPRDEDGLREDVVDMLELDQELAKLGG
jgi:hypothetical protein